MKKIFNTISIILICASGLRAQLTFPPDGGNKKALIGERIGITDVAISYSRPAVKGREGKIWGQLVHYGYKYLDFGTSKEAPWRAGANECTTISFSTDVTVEGKTLPAGKYGLFMAVQENDITLIFSKNSEAWGSFFYTPKEDVLRVNVKQLKNQPMVERLSFDFSEQTDSSAVVALLWEHWKIPFKITVNVKETVIASLRRELQGEKGFSWFAFVEAANYCLQNNTNLEEGLSWAESAITENYIGQANFTTLRTKANLLKKLGRTAESESTMKEALAKGTFAEVNQFGQRLLAQKKTAEALEVFRFNATKNPKEFQALTGLAKVYSVNGDLKSAGKYIKLAAAEAQTPEDKEKADKMAKMLAEGKSLPIEM